MNYEAPAGITLKSYGGAADHLGGAGRSYQLATFGRLNM
jgi:hypothetical protein